MITIKRMYKLFIPNRYIAATDLLEMALKNDNQLPEEFVTDYISEVKQMNAEDCELSHIMVSGDYELPQEVINSHKIVHVTYSYSLVEMPVELYYMFQVLTVERKIDAIRIFKKNINCGLKFAKDAVEYIVAHPINMFELTNGTSIAFEV